MQVETELAMAATEIEVLTKQIEQGEHAPWSCAPF